MMEDKNNEQNYWKDVEEEKDWHPFQQIDDSLRPEEVMVRVPYAPLDEQPQKAVKEDTAKPFIGYEKQIATLNELANRNRPETEDERKRRVRRERSSKIMAGVTDGIRALSNLYFTTKYSPNAYDHRRDSTMTPLQEKLEALRRERKEAGDRYYNYVLQAGALENERDKAMQAEKERQQRMNIANEEHQWEKDLQPGRVAKVNSDADAAGYRAQTEGVKAYYAPLKEQADLKLKGAKETTERSKQGVLRTQAVLNKAKTGEANARAGAVGRSNAREYRAWDRNGRERWFSDEKSALSFARQEGTAGNVEVSTTTSNDRTDPITGKKCTHQEDNNQASGISSEAEAERKGTAEAKTEAKATSKTGEETIIPKYEKIRIISYAIRQNRPTI